MALAIPGKTALQKRGIPDCTFEDSIVARNSVYPAGNAVDLAAAVGIELLDERQYRDLQQLGEFDTKTESWLQTPTDIRERGGAIFADRRYGHVFVFHNSAPSFYASRGFRGCLRV